MDDPLYAMLFAEDLIEYILNKNGINWPLGGVRQFRVDIVRERFTKEIGEAVMDIIVEKADTILTCYNTLVQKKIESKDDFRYEAAITTVYNFPTGYDEERFLNLCAILGGLSVHFAQKNNFEVADASAQILSYVLNIFISALDFDPWTSWFDLSYQAQRIRRRFQSRAL